MRWRVGAVALAAAMSLGTSPAKAAPPRDDPVAHFLLERGLIDAAGRPPGAGAEPEGEPSLARRSYERAAGLATQLAAAALQLLGVPYKRGGQSATQGFDCSGFTRHVFQAALGLVLPRRSHEQAQASSLRTVERAELEPGDLVFFNTLRAAFSHVGIYIGNGQFVHAPQTGAKVRVDNMGSAYWSQRFDGARRARQLPAPAAPPAASPAAAPAASTPAAAGD